MMNRRHFLKAAGAGVVIAVTPVTFRSDRERLEAMIRTGVVANQSFVLTDGLPVIVEGVDRLTITGSAFRWIGKRPRCFVHAKGPMSQITITYNRFYVRGCFA